MQERQNLQAMRASLAEQRAANAAREERAAAAAARRAELQVRFSPAAGTSVIFAAVPCRLMQLRWLHLTCFT